MELSSVIWNVTSSSHFFFNFLCTLHGGINIPRHYWNPVFFLMDLNDDTGCVWYLICKEPHILLQITSKPQLSSQNVPTPPSVQPCVWPPLPPSSPPQLSPGFLSSSSPQSSFFPLPPPPGCWGHSSWAGPQCRISSALAEGSQVHCYWWSLERMAGNTIRTAFSDGLNLWQIHSFGLSLIHFIFVPHQHLRSRNLHK